MPVIHTDTPFTTRLQAARIAWQSAVEGNSEVAARLTVNDVLELIDFAARETCRQVDKAGEGERLEADLTGQTDADGNFSVPAAVIPKTINRVKVDGFTLYADPLEITEHLYMGFGINDIANFVIEGGNSSSAILRIADGAGMPLANTNFTYMARKYYEFESLPEYLKTPFLMVLKNMIQEKGQEMNGSAGAGADTQAV